MRKKISNTWFKSYVEKTYWHFSKKPVDAPQMIIVHPAEVLFIWILINSRIQSVRVQYEVTIIKCWHYDKTWQLRKIILSTFEPIGYRDYTQSNDFSGFKMLKTDASNKISITIDWAGLLLTNFEWWKKVLFIGQKLSCNTSKGSQRYTKYFHV